MKMDEVHPWIKSHLVNTLRLRQNGWHFVDDIFKCIFMNGNIWISINISLKFVPMGQIEKIPALVQIMAWYRPGDKPLSEPMMVHVILLTHIYVTGPQWVKACFLQTWTSMSHPFSLNNTLGLAEGKHYLKITIPIFRLVLQNFALPGCFPCILFYRYLFSLLSSGWFVIAVCGSISVRELVK